jgi:hypothetical protein
MFLIPTFTRHSHIHGVGVFAAAAIDAGTLLWDFTEGVDWKITPEEFEQFPDPYRTRLSDWIYQTESGMYVLCGDSAKFMNHSFTPNCEDLESGTFALKDIAAGEELTCDYRVFDVRCRDGLDHWRTPACDSALAAAAPRNGSAPAPHSAALRVHAAHGHD